LIAGFELLLAKRGQLDLRRSLALELFDFFAHPRNLCGDALSIELRVLPGQLYLRGNFILAVANHFERSRIG
jgi:hypothetical protein